MLFPVINPMIASDLPPIKGQNFPVVEIPLTLPQVKLICCMIDIDQLLLLATNKSLMLISTKELTPCIN